MSTNRSFRRVVTRAPLEELWTPDGTVLTQKIADIDAETIRSFLRAGKVRFVVADIGKELHWLAPDEAYAFWKREVRPHVAAPETGFFLEDFPGGYAYIASQWQSPWPEPVVLLTRYH